MRAKITLSKFIFRVLRRVMSLLNLEPALRTAAQRVVVITSVNVELMVEKVLKCVGRSAPRGMEWGLRMLTAHESNE